MAKHLVPMLLVLIVVASCESYREPTATLVQVTDSPLAPAFLAPTATHPTTATATATSTSTPTPTPITRGAEPVTAENAGRVEQLRRWGAGEIERAFLGVGGKYLVIETKIGAYLREKDSLALLADLPNALDTAVSADLRHLAVSFPDGHVEFWDLEEARLAASVAHEVEMPKYPPADFDAEAFIRPLRIVFSPDGDHLAVAYGNGDVGLLSAVNGSMANVLRSDVAPFPVRILFTPDAKYLLSLDEGHGAFWEVGTGELVSALRNLEYVPEYPFSPDGTRLLVSRWGGEVDVLAVPYGEEIMHFGIGVLWAQVEYSKNGDYYLIGGGAQVRAEKDGKLVVGVDYKSVAPDHSLGTYLSYQDSRRTGSYSGLFDLRTTADGGLDAWGLEGPAVTRWSVFDGNTEVIELPGVQKGEASPRGQIQWVDRVRLSEDGRRIGSCTETELFVVDRVADRTFTLPGCRRQGDFGFTPDADAVWISDEGPGGRGSLSHSAVNEYAVTDGELLHTISLHTGIVQTMEYLGDGSRLLTSSQTIMGGDTYLWDANPLAKIAVLKDVHDRVLAADMTRDGRFLVVVDSVVRIFDLRSLTQIKIISVDATAIAISPDGAMLAIGTTQGGIQLVTLPRGEELAVLNGHQGGIAGLVFGQEMTALYSASSDGTVRLWGIPSSKGELQAGGKPEGTPLTPLALAEYDSFDDLRYDGTYNPDLWILRNPSLGTAAQENGVMVLSKAESGGDLLLDALGTWTYEEGFYVQADIRLDETQHDGVIRLDAGGDIDPDQWYGAECALNPDAYFSCSFKSEAGGVTTDSYESPGKALQYNTYYTIRIEIDPQHQLIRYYLNGELIGSHTPKDHDVMLGSPMHFFLSILAGPATARADNVVAGPAQW